MERAAVAAARRPRHRARHQGIRRHPLSRLACAACRCADRALTSPDDRDRRQNPPAGRHADETAPPRRARADMGHHDRIGHVPAAALGIFRPRHQSGVRLLSERDRARFRRARPVGQADGGAARKPAAVRRRLRARHPDRRAARPADRPLPDHGGGARHLRHGRLRDAAGGAGAAAGAVARPRLRGEGRGGVPDVGVPDLHQHLARRHRGAEDA